MLTASEKILQKALVGSNLDSRGWNSIQAGLRDRAFFSSQVMEPHLLDAMQKLSAEYARGGTDLSKLRACATFVFMMTSIRACEERSLIVPATSVSGL